MRSETETLECCGQFQTGYTDRESNSDLTLDGEWLQSDGPIRTAEKHIGAYSDTHRDITAGADINTGQTADGWAFGRRENTPGQCAAGSDPDIKPDRIEFADINLLRIPSVGEEATPHRLASRG